MSRVYKDGKVWLTIDVEELDDTNFNIRYKKKPEIDYEQMLDNWLELCEQKGVKSTAFTLGAFAKKYPDLVKKLHNQGHEIACHGEDHRLVYSYPKNQWAKNTKKAKEYLEDLIGEKVEGYRSPSWSLPFETEYYEDLVKMGFTYSSSYFPFKTYMYGHSEDKKKPFIIKTESGEIMEIPVPKYIIPFSGGFYLRAFPVCIQKILFNRVEKITKSVIYIHPYELTEKNPFFHYLKNMEFSIEYILAFFSTAAPLKKLERVINV